MSFTGYCTIDEVVNKTLDIAISQAGWEDTDIQFRIDEGAIYIEKSLIGIGFTREQLSAAPLIKHLNILYARYAILRDIYVNTVPSQSSPEPYTKWLDIVKDHLESLTAGKTALVNADGEIITPEDNGDIYINTANTKRIFTMGDPLTQTIDASNYDEEVIGK